MGAALGGASVVLGREGCRRQEFNTLARGPEPPPPPPRRPGNATLIGASANIVTAGMLDRAGHHFSFVQWLRVGVPVTLVTVAAANLYLLRYAFP